MKQNTFSMLDENGVEVVYDVLFTFESDDTNKKYVIFEDPNDELGEVFAYAYDDEGNLSVDYLGIIPYIVEALKTIHENSISLESTSRQEFIELAKKVEDAVEQLQTVMEQHGKTLFIEKESKDIYGRFRFTTLSSL